MAEKSRKITYNQLFFSVFCFLQASPLFHSILFGQAAQESWVLMIISAAVGFLVSLIIVLLYGKNKGLELVGICRKTAGKGVGTVLAAFYLVFFLLRLCINLARFGSFISTNMLEKTPIVVIVGYFLVGAVMCANRGAENLCGMSLWFALMVTGYVLLSIPFLGNDFRLQNLFPLFSLPSGSYVTTIITTVAEPFANLSVFLMLFDELEDGAKGLMVSPRKKSVAKTVLLSYVVSSFVMIISVIRDNGIFGHFAKYLAAPSFQSARLINVGEVLSRLELVYAIIFITVIFFRTAISLYCVSKLFSRITGCGKSTDFVLPMGILTCGLSLILFQSHQDMKEWSSVGLPFYCWIFEVILPLILLGISAVKRGSATFATSVNATELAPPLRLGKKMRQGAMIISCALTGTILFLLLFFNYRIPSPLTPLKWLADMAANLLAKIF